MSDMRLVLNAVRHHQAPEQPAVRPCVIPSCEQANSRQMPCRGRRTGVAEISKGSSKSQPDAAKFNQTQQRSKQATCEGGRRSTSFRPGVSGNPRGRPKKVATDNGQVATNGTRICLDITPLGVWALVNVV